MEDSYSHYSRIVETYIRYRPRYPDQLVAWLQDECGLSPEQIVVEFGSRRFWQKHIDLSAHFDKRQRPDYVTRFFGIDNLKEKTLDNYQVCDYGTLKGLALSFLKAPQPGDPRYLAMVDDLRAIFNQYQEDGTVTLEYDTQIVYGQLSA